MIGVGDWFVGFSQATDTANIEVLHNVIADHISRNGVLRGIIVKVHILTDVLEVLFNFLCLVKPWDI